jgi:membrane protease YdiL (CAAX protease family)
MLDGAAIPPEHPAIEPARPAILPVDRVAALLEIILCSGFPTQLLLIGVLRGFGMAPFVDGGQLNPRFVFTLSLIDTTLVIGLVFMLLRAHRESARAVLLGLTRRLREVLVGIALIPIVFMIVLAIRAVVLTWAPALHNMPVNPYEDMLRSHTDAAIFAVVVMIAGGLREEVQRGFILHRFEQYLGGGAVGVVVHSLIFGLGHLDQGYDAAIATATLGAFWGVVYLRRRSIIAPVASHAGYNLTQVLAAALR